MKTSAFRSGRTTPVTLVILAVSAILVESCGRCDLDSIGRTAEGKDAMFRIVLGEGGGFAGTWSGYTITGSGVVFRWSGKGAREHEVEIGTLDADTMCVLWDAAQPLKTVPSSDASGSLVQFLSLTLQDTTRHYAWRPRPGERPGTPYKEFYDRCVAVIQRSLTPTTSTPESSGK